MKVSALLLVAAIAAAIGYLFGTEAGRQQKDVILDKIGRKGDELGLDDVPNAVRDVVDDVSSAVDGATASA